MKRTRRSDKRQRQLCEGLAERHDAPSFLDLLQGPELLGTFEALSPEYRERLYSPGETLSMFLAQALAADRSCQRAVNERAVERLGAGLAPCSTNTGAYCQARQRLPQELISGLARRSGRLLHENTPESWRWQGRRVLMIDGTSVSMPDTAANQEHFPQHGNQAPGLGYPIARLVALFCLSSAALLDARHGAWSGKGGDEHTHLRAMLDNLERGDVLLGDANFPSYWLLSALIERGVDGVFEQIGGRRRHNDFRRGRRLGKLDHVVELVRPPRPPWMDKATYERVPRTLEVRETRVGSGKRARVLVTTITTVKGASKRSLKTLYLDRWHVELDLRNLKSTLGMDVLGSRTPEMVSKEIWVYLLAYNLIRLVMAQAAVSAALSPRQLSFKHTVQLWSAWRSRSGLGNGDEVEVLLAMIVQKRVGHRSGRKEPRAVKRRPKCFMRLWAPREIARRQMRSR